MFSGLIGWEGLLQRSADHSGAGDAVKLCGGVETPRESAINVALQFHVARPLDL